MSTSRPAHQQRVVDEHAQLQERTIKLAAFIQSPQFSSVSAEQQELLKKQYPLMDQLRDVLAQRIALFDQVPA